MPPNEALLRWFSSTYPTLVFDPNWLNGCVAYLQEHFQPNPQQLIKQVENQLLLSDLGMSTLASNNNLPDPATLTGVKNTRIAFGGPRSSVLVQIVSITDIGVSALNLKETSEKKQAERRLLQERERNGENVNAGAAAAQRDVMDGPDENDGKGPVKYARSMLRFEVSDGRNVLNAMEYKRIPELSLDETRLGCKLLLKNVRCLRGLLLLEPECVVVKGQHVEEIEAQANLIFDASIRIRLGLSDPPPVVLPAAGAGNGNAVDPPQAQPLQTPQPNPPPNGNAEVEQRPYSPTGASPPRKRLRTQEGAELDALAGPSRSALHAGDGKQEEDGEDYFGDELELGDDFDESIFIVDDEIHDAKNGKGSDQVVDLDIGDDSQDSNEIWPDDQKPRQSQTAAAVQKTTPTTQSGAAKVGGTVKGNAEVIDLCSDD